MSILTITDEQRYELGETLAVAHNDTQRFINDPKKPDAAVEPIMAPDLSAAAAALTDAGYGPTPPATQATVSNGDTIAVHTAASGGDSHNATAVVADSVLSYALLANSVILVDNTDTVRVTNSAGATISSAAVVSVVDGALNRISLPATIAGVANAGTVVVQNSAGAQAHNATATVAAGLVSNVKLAATAAIVDNAQALTVPVTGTYATTATLNVANGVITGIVLS